MKTVLAIDTSTLTASVAVVAGSAMSPRVLAEAQSGVDTHSERLLVLVDEVLTVSGCTLGDLDGLAVGAGPGSFTGLRIGMATAKGLAFATDKPLWAVSSLAALALHLDSKRDVGPGDLVIPVLDARRGEVFIGFYRLAEGTARAAAAERVTAPESLRDVAGDIIAETACDRVFCVGDGLSVHAEALGRDGDRALWGLAETTSGMAETPQAQAVGRLALSGEHANVLSHGAPAYIRLSEAEIKFPGGNPGGTFRSRK